jgi:hypothetical protein
MLRVSFIFSVLFSSFPKDDAFPSRYSFTVGHYLVNQGNSGGPLVDVESGNIVGINTCIRANMEGTSFAIPINKVMGIVDDLSEGKLITHGYLGKLDSTPMMPFIESSRSPLTSFTLLSFRRCAPVDDEPESSAILQQASDSSKKQENSRKGRCDDRKGK